MLTGVCDRTVCFHCGGGLGHWEVTDDAFAEHAFYFPFCVCQIFKGGRVCSRMSTQNVIHKENMLWHLIKLLFFLLPSLYFIFSFTMYAVCDTCTPSPLPSFPHTSHMSCNYHASSSQTTYDTCLPSHYVTPPHPSLYCACLLTHYVTHPSTAHVSF